MTPTRPERPPLAAFPVGIASVIVDSGIVFAKVGQNAGWSWWVYSALPAVTTLLVPPAVLRFSFSEL